MTASSAQNSAAEPETTAPGILLFLPFNRLPDNSGEMLDRLAGVCGLQPADLRIQLVGLGLARLSAALPLKIQKVLADEMNDLGIPAAVVPESRLRRRLSLPLARRVEIADHDIVFFDKDDDPVFTVDKTVDLIAVVADLSGRAVEKPYFGPGMEQPPPPRSFEEALKKISVNRPAAVFAARGADPLSGVLLDHAAFTYRSLGDHMDVSAGVNFRTLVNETIGRAKSTVADHRFGAEPLAGAVPDWSGGKREILTALGRYTLYLLAAAECGILRPGGACAADASYTLRDDDADADAAEADAETVDGCAPAEAALPLPPDPVDSSGISAIIRSGPAEILHALVFGLIPFLFHFINGIEFPNPLLWKTITGGSLLAGGLLLFPYALVILHYKRMVQNTPTSRVRSLAMGIVELQGRARRFYDLKTSHSQTRCVYYRCRYYRIEKSREGHRWKLIRQTDSGRLPFYLEDSTGRVMVDPKGAQFLITKSRQEFDGTASLWLSPSIQGTRTRIYEDLIAEGADIYLLGAARPERVGGTHTEKLVDRLRHLKGDPSRLEEYDANGDGRIDGAEWETARTEVERQVYAESLLDGAPAERVVVRKPLYGLLPFLIADTEQAIIRKLAFRFWVFLIGGLMMIGLGTETLVRVIGK